MTKLISHIRANVIAYLALFVALGGTSYAAVAIPRNSVGTRQLRNGAVTPAKLDRGLIGASVRAWAEVSSTGYVMKSSVPAHTIDWGTQPSNPGLGTVVFDQSVVTKDCFPLASVEQYGPTPPGNESSAVILAAGGNAVQLAMSDGVAATQAVAVVVLCPS